MGRTLGDCYECKAVQSLVHANFENALDYETPLFGHIPTERFSLIYGHPVVDDRKAGNIMFVGQSQFAFST